MVTIFSVSPFFMKIDNYELIIDQIMSYTIQAGEILQQEFLPKNKQQSYKYFFLPSGPELYT